MRLAKVTMSLRFLGCLKFTTACGAEPICRVEQSGAEQRRRALGHAVSFVSDSSTRRVSDLQPLHTNQWFVGNERFESCVVDVM
jgi:hypothetical protein